MDWFHLNLESSKETEKEKGRKEGQGLGVFYSQQHYIKIYEVLRGAYSNYKVSSSLSAICHLHATVWKTRWKCCQQSFHIISSQSALCLTFLCLFWYHEESIYFLFQISLFWYVSDFSVSLISWRVSHSILCFRFLWIWWTQRSLYMCSVSFCTFCHRCWKLRLWLTLENMPRSSSATCALQ